MNANPNATSPHDQTTLELRGPGAGAARSRSSSANRDDHGRGWMSALNKLERHLASR
jgi:hypothetical protein